MASIRHEVEIDATAEQVWDAVRDVGAVHRRLVPGLAVGARMDGDVRIVSLPDSSVVRELILDVDDEARRLAYAVLEGRMALAYHHATLEVFAEGPARSRLVWITDFLPDDMGAEIRLRTERGIQVMKRALEHGSSASARHSRAMVGRVAEPSESETRQLIAELAQAVPVLRPALGEHIDHYDEVLSYVVFADFREALEDMVDTADDANVAAFLDVVERWSGVRSDPAHAYDGGARNMIAIAFLEDGLILSGGRENRLLNALRSRFGSQTLELLAETEANHARATAAWHARRGD